MRSSGRQNYKTRTKMYSQFANEDAPASARSPSANRTKRLVHISAWATRTLAFLSTIFAVVAFTMLHEIWFGVVLCVTAVFSFSSPLNFNACCYSDCSRNTTGEKRCGLVSIFVWMFLTNMVYMILFAYSWFFWLRSSSLSYSEDWLNTVFASALIVNFCLSIFNLYSMCLVYKFGCCFMNGVDRECSEQSVNMVVVNHSQLSTIGGGVPANGSGLTMPIGPQQGQFRTGTSFPQQQPYITNMPLSLQPAQQQQPTGGATAESASLSIPHSMTPDTSGQNEAPPSYPEAVFNGKHSCA